MADDCEIIPTLRSLKERERFKPVKIQFVLGRPRNRRLYHTVVIGSIAALSLLLSWGVIPRINPISRDLLIGHHQLTSDQWKQLLDRHDVILGLSWAFATSGSTLTLDPTFNTASNNIYCIGAGRGGANGAGATGGGGGGGGAFATLANYNLNGPNASVGIQVAGANTIFDTTNNAVIAVQGAAGSGATGGTGGAAASCTPSTGAFSGGTGGASGSGLDGGGGGGAAGPNGNGNNGSAGITTNGGNGGSGDGGVGGSGGAAGSCSPSGGGGTEWSASPNRGSGGGGGGGATGIAAAGAGGAYGAGGGGGSKTSLQTGAAGTGGLIAVSWTPASGGAATQFLSLLGVGT
jgi:hypothetical protein